MVQQKHDKRQAQVFFDFIVAINGINLEPKALIFVGKHSHGEFRWNASKTIQASYWKKSQNREFG